MFVAVSHHFCKPGQAEAAAERVDKNGGAMTREPGFLYRYRLDNPTKPEIVTTFTVWNTEADYKGFRDRRAARGEPAGQAMPWDRVEGESYEVRSAHGNAPK